MSVAEAQERISATEFLHWQEFYRLEPFGPSQDDLRAGAIVSTLWNANRGKSTPVKHPHDFFPSCKPRRRPVDPRKLRDMFLAHTIAAGGVVNG